ncbi:MAG TPA: ribonuclease E inhibitor RraB [Candidatus Angelobacter sp.]|jgi:hypothetical protein
MKKRLLLILFVLLGVSCVFGFYQSTDPDQLLIEQLSKSGADVSKAHDIAFLLYFPNSDGAAKAMVDIYEKKFDAEIKKPEKAGEPWSCIAKKTMVPELKAMQKIRRQFVTIATANGGEYHGWSAIPVK